jgi:hypothetical protein
MPEEWKEQRRLRSNSARDTTKGASGLAPPFREK